MQAPHIDDYSFGRMEIDGERYTSDLIILPDGTIQENWWRKSGHNLVPADISEVLERNPDMLIVGTGASGMMHISDEARGECERRGVRIRAERTGDATASYNEAAEGGRSVAACFHLTC